MNATRKISKAQAEKIITTSRYFQIVRRNTYALTADGHTYLMAYGYRTERGMEVRVTHKLTVSFAGVITVQELPEDQQY